MTCSRLGEDRRRPGRDPRAARRDPSTSSSSRAVEGDFSTSRLDLARKRRPPGRPRDLPDARKCRQAATLTVIDDVHVDADKLVWVDAADQVDLACRRRAGPVRSRRRAGPTRSSPSREATDRGRYLWLRLGPERPPAPAPDGVGRPRTPRPPPLGPRHRAAAQPARLAAGAVRAPRSRSRTRPAPISSNASWRLFEGQFTRIETAFESVSRLLNPRAADAEWLDFVAAWLDLSFDPSWPIERRRQLVIEGAALQAGAGARRRRCVRYLEIYTGAPAGDHASASALARRRRSSSARAARSASRRSAAASRDARPLRPSLHRRRCRLPAGGDRRAAYGACARSSRR